MTATVSMTSRLKHQSFLMVVLAIVFAVAATFIVSQAGLRHVNLRYVPELVAVPNPTAPENMLYVQKFEVTIAQWNRCFDEGGCEISMQRFVDAGVDYPATGVNRFDVAEYITWINRRSGHKFRLPSEAEWLGLAQDVLPQKATSIFTQPELAWASAYLTEPQSSRKLRKSGSFSQTKSGIADMDGSVWEWTQSCYGEFAKEHPEAPCPAYQVGGEHTATISVFTRDPARGGCAAGSPPAHLGLRLVTDMPVS